MAVAFTNTFTPTDSSGVASVAGVSTYSSISIGTAAADRIVVLGVVTEASGATINSATIDFGGGAVAMHFGTAGVLGSQNVQLFWQGAPTGTTATFAITFGAAVTGGAGGTNNICVYKVTGASENPPEIGAVNDTDADPISTAAITVPTDGGLLVLYNGATDSTSRSWTGATVDINADAGAMRLSTGTSLGAGSITATVSGANQEDATLSYVVFRPPAVNFGEVVGISSNSVDSITNPFKPIHSIDISVGDLVLVTVAEAGGTATSTACGDNLGNSYTALASAVSGLINTSAFYSIATVAGECTPSVTATASANDANIACAVYKGPFSGLDINSAAADADTASPYLSPASGTLAQADELITAYFAFLGTSAPTSPTPSPAVVEVIAIAPTSAQQAFITRVVVSSNSTVTMGVTIAQSKACAIGIATFKKGGATAWQGTAALTGVGSQATTPVLSMRAATTTFAGAGNLTVNLAKPALVATANFAGTGSLVATPVLSMRAAAAFAGAGALSATSTAFRLLSNAAFPGVGSFAAAAKVHFGPTAAFAGVGSLAATAKFILSPLATFAGAGSFTVDATTTRGALTAEAAFAGAGSLIANALHFSAGVYDETGAATLSISGGAFTELEFGLKLDYDNLQTGDVLSFRIYLDGQPLTTYNVTPSLTIAAHAISATAAFAGIGSLSIDSIVLRGALEGAATLAGVGNFAIVPSLRMMAQGTFIGAGLMSVDLTKLAIWQGEAAFVGAGIIAATVKLRMAALATFAGSGAVSFSGASIRIAVGSNILQGAGNFAATAKLLAQARATFAGTGSISITPQEWMAARASFVGAGSLVADLVKLAAYWQGEATFVGAGNFLTSSKFLLAGKADFAGVGSYFAASQIRLSPTATYAGVGLFSARVTQQLMAGFASFSGSGSLSVNVLQLGKIFESAAFSGVGSLVAITRQWMAMTANYAGAGNASIAPSLRMAAAKTTYAGAGSINVQPSLIIKAGARATFSGVGNQSALAFILCNVSANFAGVGNMATMPRLVMDSGEVDFSGMGLMAVTARQRMMVTGTFGGESNFGIAGSLRMWAFANYSGEGSMVADLTPPVMVWTGQATLSGEGTLSAIGTFDLATTASMNAAGNISVDTIRFINLSEQFFAGTGSLIVGDVRQILGAFANYGGRGNMTIATLITSARDYWLICSGIAMQPEILADAAMAAAVAGSLDMTAAAIAASAMSAAITGSLDLTTPLDGTPAVREC